MSLAFGGAFRITHNSGEESQGNNASKKVKLENGQVIFGAQQGKKREVLGTITNNVDQPVRVQPFRAAKVCWTIASLANPLIFGGIQESYYFLNTSWTTVFFSRQAAVTNTFTTGSRRFNDENAFSRPGKSAFVVPAATHQQFTIHIDSESVVSKAQGTALSSFQAQEPELGAAVTSLSRPPLGDIFGKSGESQDDSGKLLFFVRNLWI